MSDKWRFYEDKAGEYRWRRTAPNGKIVGASSEGYKNQDDCLANARRHGYENCSDLGSNDKWTFYKDKANENRWRRTSKNGKIVGASTEGYKSKGDCQENAQRNGYMGY